MGRLREVAGFKLMSLRFDENTDHKDILYVKEHSVREKCEQKPSDRTIFILNCPPYATKDGLKNAFSTFGAVKSVYFHSNPTAQVPPLNESKFFTDHPEVKGYRVAYVVFSNPSTVSKVMLAPQTHVLTLSTVARPIHIGFSKWAKDYNDRIADQGDLQKEIDSYMAEYDARVETTEKEAKAELEEDDDGWVKVSRKGRRPGFSRKESVRDKVIKREDSKKKKKQLLNFYRFQIRESKMNHLVKLREKFEEDKKKIAVLKESRKFKPF